MEFPDDLQPSRTEAQEDGEVTVETELDAQVQVVAQAVASNADLSHDALDAMDMGDIESGIDSDFELSLIWTMIRLYCYCYYIDYIESTELESWVSLLIH